MTSFKVLVSLMLIAVYQASTTTLVSADLIDDTCKITDFPALCASTLRSDPRSATADIKRLANVVLLQTLAKANATLVQANKLSNESVDPDVKKTLVVCTGLYQSAIGADIPDAIKSLDSEAFEDARENSKAVGRDANGCEDAFAASKLPSPLTDSDKTLSQLARIAEQIITVLG